jgi:hypothetical protein
MLIPRTLLTVSAVAAGLVGAGVLLGQAPVDSPAATQNSAQAAPPSATLQSGPLATQPAQATQASQTSPGQGPAAQKPAQQFYVEDGGTSEILESIVIPPKAEAPFTLTLQTEWVKTLYDGGTITSVNQRKIARDSKGRIYQERWYLVPKNGKVESEMTTIQISDPNAHTHYNCFMLHKPHVCVLLGFTPTTNSVYKFESPLPGSLPEEVGKVTHDDLGKQTISGVETTGTRDATIYNAGLFGNDRKVAVEKEFWYSPQLGINLISKRSDPRFGVQTFTVTNLILAEPDPKLFELPEGFKVEDRRETAQPVTD